MKATENKLPIMKRAYKLGAKEKLCSKCWLHAKTYNYPPIPMKRAYELGAKEKLCHKMLATCQNMLNRH